MRVDKALIIAAETENYSAGEEIINNAFYEIDTEDFNNLSVLARDESKYHTWLDGIEYIQPQFFDIVELAQITKVRANEMLEITQSTFPLLDRIQMHYQVKGLIVINNKEIANFIIAAFREADKIKKHENINKEIEKTKNKIEELKNENKKLRAKRTALNQKLKIIDKKEKKEQDKNKKADFISEKGEINSSIEEIKDALLENTQKMNLLDSKLSDLKVYAHETRPLVFNLFSEYTSLFNLLNKYEIVAVNEEHDLIILNINKKNSGSALTISALSNFVDNIKNAEKDRDEIVKIIVDQWKKVGPMEFKFKLNAISSKVYEEETFFDAEEEGLLKHQLDILAPVKPTIAAAMLASGSTGAFSHEIPIENERCLIKTVISPVVKVSKELSRTGEETIVTIKTWEPRLGIFNKTRKTFKVLTQ